MARGQGYGGLREGLRVRRALTKRSARIPLAVTSALTKSWVACDAPRFRGISNGLPNCQFHVHSRQQVGTQREGRVGTYVCQMTSSCFCQQIDFQAARKLDICAGCIRAAFLSSIGNRAPGCRCPDSSSADES